MGHGSGGLPVMAAHARAAGGIGGIKLHNRPGRAGRARLTSGTGWATGPTR
jgi:hypothetical protein